MSAAPGLRPSTTPTRDGKRHALPDDADHASIASANRLRSTSRTAVGVITYRSVGVR